MLWNRLYSALRAVEAMGVVDKSVTLNRRGERALRYLDKRSTRHG